MSKSRYVIVTIIFILAFTFQVRGQRVGLVLSGGGAKGMAHIGVIRALEENHIPIDYITGTSMGAIIAGLYAAGYTPDEMEALFKSNDFKLWSTGIIPPQFVYYFKKLEDDPSLIGLDFARKKDKLQLVLPTNIIPEEQMDFAFMELFSSTSAACNYNFDNLFVPFRCVASDIYKNSQVVLSSGDLGAAIRASMTYPFYFKPIEIDSVLLFDGGLVNNFPANVMQEDFHPDIIIGSNVASENKRPTADDVFGQLENMIVKETKYELPDSNGIMLDTHLSGVNLLDFEHVDSISDAGYRTAMHEISRIRSKISRRINPAELKEKREEFKKEEPKLLFNNIQVSGVGSQQRAYIIRSIRHNSSVFNLDDLRTEYFKLVADDKIKSIQPYAVYNKKTGYFDLQLNVEQQRPLAVGLGGYFSLSDINQGFAGVDYKILENQSYTFQSNLHFGRFYSSFMLGTRIDFPDYHPYSLEFYFTLNRWDYLSSNSEIFFEDSKPPYVIRDENNFRLNLGFPVGTRGKWETGFTYSNALDNYYQTTSFKQEDTPDETRFLSWNIHARYEHKTLNRKQYPTLGTYKMLEAAYVMGNEDYIPGTTAPITERSNVDHQFFEANMMYDQYIPMARWLTIGITLDGYYSSRTLFSNYTASTVSAHAFTPTPNSMTRYLPNYRSDFYGAGGLKIIIPLTPSTHFRLEGYYFQPVRTLQRDDNNVPYYTHQYFTDYHLMGSGGFIVQTPFGPASLMLNYYDKDLSKWYMQVGFGYILFNKRGQ